MASEDTVKYAVRKTDGSVEYLTRQQIQVLNGGGAKGFLKRGAARFAFLKDMAIFGVAAIVIVVLLVYATKNSPARSYTFAAGGSDFKSSIVRSEPALAGGSNASTSMAAAAPNNSEAVSQINDQSNGSLASSMAEDLSPIVEPAETLKITQPTDQITGAAATTQPQNQGPQDATQAAADNALALANIAALNTSQPVTQPVAAAAVPNPFAEQEKQARKLIENWASSWARQDVNGYINTYAPEYSPSKDVPHKDWMRKRMERLITPRSIDISLSNIKIAMLSATDALITFDQFYRSPSYQDTVGKVVKARNLDGKWFIVEEASAPK